ncbi:MAG: penicillin-binding protein 2 [Chlamydiales bacterium]|nr:penicillin-binding protein 2 [Chlamydiales bacterium]
MDINKVVGRKRLLYVAFFVLVLFSLLIVQFFKIQIVEGEKWTREARRQHQFVIADPFHRGLFYSNTAIKKGHPHIAQPLVVDVPKFHLFADPGSLSEPLKAEVVSGIAQTLHLTKEESEKVRAHLSKKSRNRKLRMWLSQEERNNVLRWWDGFYRKNKLPRNALYFIQDYKRSYPFGHLLGQVLHTIREECDVKSKETIPTGGLELYFNKQLQGKEGKRLLLRSPRHPLDTVKVLASPENGADIHLTVNHYIQAIAEEEIEKAVKKANAKSGWALMMHPRTGEIFALAQYPYFDPSNYAHYFETQPEETKVKAITDPYEPGSTMKPLTLAICLKANAELQKQGKKPIFFPEEKVATANGRFPGRSKPISDLHPHNFLNMDLALQKSSNIYMSRMIQRVIEALGEKWYRSCLQDLFGFGVKTGIELPGESIGLLPAFGKKHPNGALEWSTATPFSLAFGHNILVSSLQMVKSYAVIANGGFDVRPTLVRKIVKTDASGKEEVIQDNTSPEKIAQMRRLLEPEIVDRVIRSMKFVTKPGGTASKGDVPGYTEVGKTATTEKIVSGTYSKRDHIATFIGFTPAKNAEFVLLIAIDDPEFKYIPGVGKNQHGGNCCAPAFKEISMRTLQYLGVEPDDPHGYPRGDPRFDPNKADWLKEIKALRELYLQWNH